MPFAISTAGQGSTSYIALPNWSAASATEGTGGYYLRVKFSVASLAAINHLIGSTASSAGSVRTLTDGSVRYRNNSADLITSSAGLVIVDQIHELILRRVYTPTSGIEILLDGASVGLTTTTTLGFLTNVNQLGRFSTTNRSDITVYEFEVFNGAASYQAVWDETGASGSGVNWADDSATRNLTITNATGAADSWWIYYGGVTQHQSTSGTATQAATSVADNTARNGQHRATTGTATQAANSVADTTARNGQQRVTAGSAAQTAIAVATTELLNNQHHQVTGTTAQEFAGSADTTASNSQNKATSGNAAQIYSAQISSAPLNTQHRQSAGQLLSVAGFIADTGWVNTVDLGKIQHRGTSGSAAQSATAAAATSALNNQQRQTSGNTAQAATGTADTTASNSQRCQSAGQVLSVAGFIASTSWVNTVDLGNIQHRGTSGSATQAATAAATATAINGQNRQSAGRATAECTTTASTSRVNTILQKAVYVRRIGSQSITKKIYHTASRHKIELKTQRGGGYMQELNFKQGASALLQIEHDIDEAPVTGISEAKYELYGRTGQVLVTKELGEGIEFSEGLIEIQLTENDTAELSQSYNHQCVAKDLAGLTFFPLNGQITFGATKPRL